MTTSASFYWMEAKYAYDRLFFNKGVFKKRKFFLGMDKEGHPTDGFVEAHFKVVGQLPMGYECANHYLAQIPKKAVHTEFWYGEDWSKCGCFPTKNNKVETVAALNEIREAIWWCIEMDRKYNKQRPLAVKHTDTPTSWFIGDLEIQIALKGYSISEKALDGFAFSKCVCKKLKTKKAAQ